MQGLDDAGQQGTIAAVGEVGLHVADNDMPLVHDQAAQVLGNGGLIGRQVVLVAVEKGE
jgi:hypothetical protein